MFLQKLWSYSQQFSPASLVWVIGKKFLATLLTRLPQNVSSFHLFSTQEGFEVSTGCFRKRDYIYLYIYLYTYICIYIYISHGVPWFMAKCLFIQTSHPSMISGKCQDMGLLLPLASCSLHEYLNGCPLMISSPENALENRCRLAVQIFMGLQFIHAKQVVHLDLKASNVLLVLDSQSKNGPPLAWLADFGLSQQMPGHVFGHLVCSKPYRPVECHCSGREKMKLTPALDIFSLGCLLFELIQTGPHRFLFPSAEDMFHGLPLPVAQQKAADHVAHKLRFLDPAGAETIKLCTAPVRARGELESARRLWLTQRCLR